MRRDRQARAEKGCRHRESLQGERLEREFCVGIAWLKRCVIPKLLSILAELASSPPGKLVDKCLVQPLKELFNDALEERPWSFLTSAVALSMSIWVYTQDEGLGNALLTGMAMVCASSLFRTLFRKKRKGQNEH